MLKLLLGKAGAGKTGAVIERIKQAVKEKQGGQIYIIPEQYSHEAERELCRECGDSLSLYAETFSFTGLSRRVMSRVGGGAEKYLDKGGRILCMALAVNSVAAHLKVYGAARRKAELQAMLLSAVDELKSACIGSETLIKAAVGFEDGLGDKLSDLAMILEAYEAIVRNGHADPADRLSILAQQIPESDIGAGSHIYIDGFIDFTGQEKNVIAAMLKQGAEVCVCLTADSLEGDNEIYELSRRAARGLIRTAQELGISYEIETLNGEADKTPSLAFFTDNMFSYGAAEFAGENAAIELWQAENAEAECELAAAKAIELVRDWGCRWRDISVAVRGFEDYRGILESVFRHYGVPLYSARRSDMLSKPLPAMIAAAYEIIWSGWNVDDVVDYMRTGLIGLDSRQCDKLENYIFKWQLRGSAWQRQSDWRQHPDGYGMEYDEESLERLKEINELRRRLAGPLQSFAVEAEAAETASGQAAALASLFAELRLPDTLKTRADKLRSAGRETQSAEYQQLWVLAVSALEQCAAILGDTPMDGREFGKLYLLVLSQYDVGTIPVSLDRVSAGDFDRNRRRNIKHLIVLGADDQRIPMSDEAAGVFSQDERRRLNEAELDLGGGENELWREFSLIYNTLTLPSESLTMSYPAMDGEGGERRGSLVYNRAKAIFNISAKHVELSRARTAAAGPALSLAAMGLRSGGIARSALDYFRRGNPEVCEALEKAADMGRGRLSEAAIERIYGKKLKLSASRIDKFSSCRFSYFCQYGLQAKPYEPAGFSPPEIGSFMHYVLENTAREAKKQGGFKKLEREKLRELTDRFVQEYVHEELDDFQEKSSRFVYLFKRLTADVHQIVEDMAAELCRSDFEPLDFELDFSKAGDLPPVELGEGEESVSLTGIADRVDGWVHEGKLYLRVVDYKTGKKKFSLSDVWYGMGLQMLLYLFSLEADGESRYGREIVPAGVIYVPARSVLLPLPAEPDNEELEKKRGEELRRSGLVLEDAALIEAWEHGDDKRYIPVKLRSGKATADSLANLERFGALEKHIKKQLRDMAQQLRGGSIAADPYYRSQQENACLNCDYFDVCHFADGENGESNRYMPKLSAEKVWSRMEGGDDNE